jgi:hypothetical protein
MPGRHAQHRFARAQETAGDVGGEDAPDARSASICSTRIWRARMPALLTRASRRPQRASTSANMRSTSASCETSACTAKAAPPASSMARTTWQGGIAVGTVVDADLVAAAGGQPRAGGADAAAGAGNKMVFVMRSRIARTYSNSGRIASGALEGRDLAALGAGREAVGHGREAFVGSALASGSSLFRAVRTAQARPALGLFREHEAHAGALARTLGGVDVAREAQRLGAGGAQVGHVVHAVGRTAIDTCGRRVKPPPLRFRTSAAFSS